jgi:hypothetical protein
VLKCNDEINKIIKNMEKPDPSRLQTESENVGCETIKATVTILKAKKYYLHQRA